MVKPEQAIYRFLLEIIYSAQSNPEQLLKYALSESRRGFLEGKIDRQEINNFLSKALGDGHLEEASEGESGMLFFRITPEGTHRLNIWRKEEGNPLLLISPDD